MILPSTSQGRPPQCTSTADNDQTNKAAEILRQDFAKFRENLLQSFHQQLRYQEQFFLAAFQEESVSPLLERESAGFTETECKDPRFTSEKKCFGGDVILTPKSLEEGLRPIHTSLHNVELKIDQFVRGLSLPVAGGTYSESCLNSMKSVQFEDVPKSTAEDGIRDIFMQRAESVLCQGESNFVRGLDDDEPCDSQFSSSKQRSVSSYEEPSEKRKSRRRIAYHPLLLYVDESISEIEKRRFDANFRNFKRWAQLKLFRAVRSWMVLEEPPRSGWVSSVVNNPRFEVSIALIIVLNAAFMMYATDYGMQNLKKPQNDFMKGAELGFLLCFAVELVLKLIAHRLYFFCNDEMRWNIFDFFLVTIASYDTISMLTMIGSEESGDNNMTFMRSIRIFKMAKSLRALRLLQFVSELRMMLNSVTGSLSSLFWSCIMLFFILYLFSLAFVQVFTAHLVDHVEDLDPETVNEMMSKFGTVMRSMISCFKATTGGDDWSMYYKLFAEVGALGQAMFLFFIGFMHIALWNILTGIFVEHAMKLAQPEYNALALEQRKKQLTEATELRKLFNLSDDGSGRITARAFKSRLTCPKVMSYLSVLGLEIRDATFFFEMLADYSENNSVDIDFFVEACLKMKGPATSLDMQSLTFETKAIHVRCMNLEKQLNVLKRNQAPTDNSEHHVAKSFGETGPRCSLDNARSSGRVREPQFEIDEVPSSVLFSSNEDHTSSTSIDLSKRQL